MDVFMTGANGFVGLNTVAALKAAGHRVTAYVRPDSNVSYLEPLGVRILRGSLSDPGSIALAMRGAQAVIHTAGNTSCNRRDLPALMATNVTGTSNVVEAAITNRVERIVYTSTTSTIGADATGRERADESKPLRGFRARSPYAVTKQLAEEIVLGAIRHDVECIILNPAEIIGPYDHNMQWGRLVLAAHHNQLPFVPPGGASFCSAVEVGRAHVSALTRGRSGERYILGGQDRSFAEFIDTITGVLGKPCDLPDTSYAWLFMKAILQEKFPDLMPGKSAAEPYRMRVFAGHYYFNSDKARQELDYACPPLRQMLQECVDWYRRHGYFDTSDQTEISTPPQEGASWIPER